MSALMAERRERGEEARQESLFEALAPPRAPWAEPPQQAATPLAEPETETKTEGERRVPRTAGVPLAGPTLDDTMSRVWEGLVTGLPAACPVCHGEVEPSLGGPLSGRCRSCDTAID